MSTPGKSGSDSSQSSSNYVTIKELGKGTFATVFLAEHTITKKRYAVKRIKNPDSATIAATIHQQQQQAGETPTAIDPNLLEKKKRRREELIAREISIWWDLEAHPNIVTLVEAFRSKNNTYLVLELMGGGSLEDVLDTSREKRNRLKEAKMQSWFVQMVQAVAFLHSKGIVHRDIKPANVLLTQDWKHAKICDFGLAREHPEGGLPTKKCGSYAYMAAEAWHGNHDGFKSDMWALGVTLYEMLTCDLPFNGNGSQLYAQIVDSAPVMPNYLSEDVKQVITALLRKSPKQRPAAVQLLQYPWIRQGIERQRAAPADAGSPLPANLRPPAVSPGQTPLHLSGAGPANNASTAAVNHELSVERNPLMNNDTSCQNDTSEETKSEHELSVLNIPFDFHDPADEPTESNTDLDVSISQTGVCPSLARFSKILDKLSMVVSSTITSHGPGSPPSATTPTTGSLSPTNGSAKEFSLMVECASQQGAICIVEVLGRKNPAAASQSTTYAPRTLVLKKVRGRGKAMKELAEAIGSALAEPEK